MTPSALSSRCAIAIMAKAPQPGRSKTRLCPPLLPTEAAILSGTFLADMTATVARAGRSAPIDGYVAFAPAGAEATLATYVAAGTRLLLADGAGIDAPGVQGFGRALLQTLRSLLDQGYGSACVLNSDSPTLPADVLITSCTMLDDPRDRVVIGPAGDGGYYLLGLRHAHSALFADIAWSTGDVTAQTRAQARRAGLDVLDLPEWHDVDDEAGLRRLMATPDLNATAPATSAAIARLGLRQRCGLG